MPRGNLCAKRCPLGSHPADQSVSHFRQLAACRKQGNFEPSRNTHNHFVFNILRWAFSMPRRSRPPLTSPRSTSRAKSVPENAYTPRIPVSTHTGESRPAINAPPLAPEKELRRPKLPSPRLQSTMHQKSSDEMAHRAPRTPADLTESSDSSPR